MNSVDEASICANNKAFDLRSVRSIDCHTLFRGMRLSTLLRWRTCKNWREWDLIHMSLYRLGIRLRHSLKVYSLYLKVLENATNQCSMLVNSDTMYSEKLLSFQAEIKSVLRSGLHISGDESIHSCKRGTLPS